MLQTCTKVLIYRALFSPFMLQPPEARRLKHNRGIVKHKRGKFEA
jgi:hypothetical protein